MTPLFWRALARHPLRHPWQLGLAILGIALGVAVVVAVDLANASARRSFALAMERIAGQATHRIVGGVSGVAEAQYVQMRVGQALRPSAPVVTGYLPNADRPGQLLQILGIDPLAEAPFRHPAADLSGADFDIRALLIDPAAALLPEALGEAVTVQHGEQRFTLRRAGTLRGPELDGLIITDISTAQTLLGMAGRLSHIDLILPDGAAGERQAEALRTKLPPGLRLERPDQRNQALADLSASFSLNLTAMSLLALIVGMFLIYNAMTFSIVQRRSLLGLLRALGVSRRELLIGVLGEALLLGLAGTLLGGVLGLWLGSALVHLDAHHQRSVLRSQRPRVLHRADSVGQRRGAGRSGDIGGGLVASAGSRCGSARRGVKPGASGKRLAGVFTAFSAGRTDFAGGGRFDPDFFTSAGGGICRAVSADDRLCAADAADSGRSGGLESAVNRPLRTVGADGEPRCRPSSQPHRGCRSGADGGVFRDRGRRGDGGQFPGRRGDLD